MDKDFDDFADINFDQIETNEKLAPFTLKHLSLKHVHFNSGDKDSGIPIYTSIELKSSYDQILNSF